MNLLFNHLWQSTWFAGAVAFAAVWLRKNSPRTRYWLWLGASVKFLIPFSLFVWTGSSMQLPPDSPSLQCNDGTGDFELPLRRYRCSRMRFRRGQHFRGPSCSVGSGCSGFCF